MDKMKKTGEQDEAQWQAYEAEVLALIKSRMPSTYRAIQDRAAVLGPGVYGLVRRGIRGEAGCFFAVENGEMVGTGSAQLLAFRVEIGNGTD
jgi:hypothetical protein